MYKLPEKVFSRRDLNDSTEFEATLKSFVSETDIVCFEIKIQEQTYIKGDLIVINVEDSDNITVGVVQAIVVRGENIFFVSRNTRCSRNWLRFFETEAIDSHCTFVKWSHVSSYKPLIKRGTMEAFNFFMHHFISHDYT